MRRGEATKISPCPIAFSRREEPTRGKTGLVRRESSVIPRHMSELAIFSRSVLKTHRPAKPNPSRPVGLGWFLRLGGLGWVTNFFFNSGSGWIWVIKLQTRQTRPDPPLFNIYLKYIIYLINFF